MSNRDPEQRTSDSLGTAKTRPRVSGPSQRDSDVDVVARVERSAVHRAGGAAIVVQARTRLTWEARTHVPDQRMWHLGLRQAGCRCQDRHLCDHPRHHSVFIPVFCLGAYRVRDGKSSGILLWSRSSYYFLERVPLSTLARRWNYVSGAIIALLLASALVGR